ncbi:MAG: SDR family NAD(P)-dependent oxidoreductase [Microthrixaceae bacterium]
MTGAGGGIGARVVQRLREGGYAVVAGDITPPAGGDEAVHTVELDVTDDASVNNAIDVATKLGDLAALANCAAVLRETRVEDTDPLDVTLQLEVNLAGTIRTTRSATQHMDSGAAVLNISSTASPAPADTAMTVYSATKGGVEAYTRAMANELGGRGIRVNAIQPGYTRTAMLSQMLEPRFEAAVTRRIPLQRLAEPREIAEVVEFLLSPRAAYVNGAVIPVDGGVLTVN